VFHAGAWLDGPTAAEKKSERMAIIALAHDAGIHVPAVHGCPQCEPLEVAHINNAWYQRNVTSRLQHNSHYGVALDAVEAELGPSARRDVEKHIFGECPKDPCPHHSEYPITPHYDVRPAGDV
jgi:hypothetical protein